MTCRDIGWKRVNMIVHQDTDRKRKVQNLTSVTLKNRLRLPIIYEIQYTSSLSGSLAGCYTDKPSSNICQDIDQKPIQLHNLTSLTLKRSKQALRLVNQDAIFYDISFNICQYFIRKHQSQGGSLTFTTLRSRSPSSWL